MPQEPLVTVLLPIYGNEPYLKESLASLADQTLPDFEVVAVTEALSSETADALANPPVPVREVAYKGDGGLAGALNAGLDHCEGRYVARMDADDVAHEDRLEKQVRFLEAHSEVGVLGSGYERIDEASRPLGRITPPTTHLGIRWRLLLTSCVPHPTVVFRRALLEETGIRYRPSFDAAEDFDLWTRLARETKIRNLPTPLVRYRVEGDKKSERDADRQQAAIDRIVVREINTRFRSGLSPRAALRLRRLLYDGASAEIDRRAAAEDYLTLLRSFERIVADGRRIPEVRTDAAVTLARALLRPPVELRALQPLVTLWELSPTYPFYLGRFLFRRRVLNRPFIRRIVTD